MKHSKSVKCNDMTIAGKIVAQVQVNDFMKSMGIEPKEYDSFANSEDWVCAIRPTGEFINGTEQVELTISWN